MRASRRSEVDPFIVMDVMEAARQAEAAGRRVIHMEVGQPGTPAPQGARSALVRAMATDSGDRVLEVAPATPVGLGRSAA